MWRAIATPYPTPVVSIRYDGRPFSTVNIYCGRIFISSSTFLLVSLLLFDAIVSWISHDDCDIVDELVNEMK